MVLSDDRLFFCAFKFKNMVIQNTEIMSDVFQEKATMHQLTRLLTIYANLSIQWKQQKESKCQHSSYHV
jgi:hypothetical protein